MIMSTTTPGRAPAEQQPLAMEIAEFDRRKAELERHHMGKFVVIKDTELAGVWDTLDAAASAAVKRYGRGPYLIRQVGAQPVSLPASVYMRAVA